MRLVLFVVALLVVLGAAAGGIGWFARAGYFVGEEGGDVVIYKGRPGGLLWFDPTVADRTGVALEQIRPSRHDEIRAGRETSSLTDARAYVDNNLAPTTTTTTTTATTLLPPPPPPGAASPSAPGPAQP